MTLYSYRKTILAAFLIIFACLGFGRFTFGMILPNMQESLAISTTQIGFISSANFIGYFVGIFFINTLYNKFETYKLIVGTLLLQGLSMLLMVFFSEYKTISFFYFFSGFFAAIVNLSLMAYMANIVPKNIRGKVLGIVVSGSGLAIIFSGLIVPFIEGLSFDMPWKYSWAIFSFFLILISFVSLGAIKKDTSHHMDENKTSFKSYISENSFWKIALLYIIFGITYIIYVTFFVSAVMDKYELNTSISSWFWILFGFISIFSGFVFGYIADKVGAFKSLVIVFLLQGFAQIILALNFDSSFIWISVVLYGITAWSVPSLVALLSSIYFDVKKTAQVLSLLTLLFAIAQTIAPVLAGFIKDYTHSFDLVFIFSSSLCFLAVILAYFFSKNNQKKLNQI
jgi:predicted MFS family arabinose efflux permease